MSFVPFDTLQACGVTVSTAVTEPVPAVFTLFVTVALPEILPPLVQSELSVTVVVGIAEKLALAGTTFRTAADAGLAFAISAIIADATARASCGVIVLFALGPVELSEQADTARTPAADKSARVRRARCFMLSSSDGRGRANRVKNGHGSPPLGKTV